jgi:hypothetical protein
MYLVAAGAAMLANGGYQDNEKPGENYFSVSATGRRIENYTSNMKGKFTLSAQGRKMLTEKKLEASQISLSGITNKPALKSTPEEGTSLNPLNLTLKKNEDLRSI